MFTLHYFKRMIVLIGATSLACCLSYSQYGTDRPLDQGNGVLMFVVTVSRLIELNKPYQDKPRQCPITDKPFGQGRRQEAEGRR